MIPDYPKKSVLEKWHRFTLKDAYEPRDPIEYLAGQIFEIPSFNVIYGAPGSLKSFFLADLAVCVAGGKSWLPSYIEGVHPGLLVKKGPVVWLDFDNGTRRTHDRFSALGKRLELPPETPLFYYSMPDPILKAGNEYQVEELAKIIKECKAILVVIDNLGIISGDVDENSNSMIPVLSHLRGLVESTGTVMIVIHHRRKSTYRNGRTGDNLRGHSSIESALDLVLQVDRKEGVDTISIQATKERGAGIPAFSAYFRCKNDNNKQLIEARFYSVESDKDIETAVIMKVIYDSAGVEQFNKGTLTEMAHSKLNNQNGNKPIGKKTIGDCIDKMVDLDFLFLTEGKNNAQLFTRNPEKVPKSGL
jgi:RecA-family ATPase